MDNKWIRLGSTEPEMYRELAKLAAPGSSSVPGDRIRMSHVIREWRADQDEGLPAKGEKTRREWGPMVDRLEEFFGEARPREIKPRHIKSFMNYDRWNLRTSRKDENGEPVFEQRALGRVSANRHVEILSTILTYAIQRGYLDENPCREVKRNRERARTLLPSDQDFREVRARVTGMRKGDVIALERSNLTDEGIQYVPSKTEQKDGRARLIPWSTDLRAIVDEALDLQRARGIVSPYVFTSPRANRWTNSGLNSAWARVDAGFHFHDIRAMAASKHESMEDAKRLLAHTSETTTMAYRRGVVKVKPVSRLSEDSGEYRLCA